MQQIWKDQLSVVVIYTRNGVVSSQFAKLYVELASAAKTSAVDMRFYALEWTKLDQRDISTLGIIVEGKDVVKVCMFTTA